MKFVCPDCGELSSFNVYPDSDEGHFVSDSDRESLVSFVLAFALGVERGERRWHGADSFSTALTDWFQDHLLQLTRCKNDACRRFYFDPKDDNG